MTSTRTGHTPDTSCLSRAGTKMLSTYQMTTVNLDCADDKTSIFSTFHIGCSFQPQLWYLGNSSCSGDLGPLERCRCQRWLSFLSFSILFFVATEFESNVEMPDMSLAYRIMSILSNIPSVIVEVSCSLFQAQSKGATFSATSHDDQAGLLRDLFYDIWLYIIQPTYCVYHSTYCAKIYNTTNEVCKVSGALATSDIHTLVHCWSSPLLPPLILTYIQNLSFPEFCVVH